MVPSPAHSPARALTILLSMLCLLLPRGASAVTATSHLVEVKTAKLTQKTGLLRLAAILPRTGCWASGEVHGT